MSTATTTTLSRWKSYPQYKDSGVEWIGEIPVRWETKCLKYVARLGYGDSLSADLREEGTTPVFGSNGLIGFHSTANTLSPALIVGRKGSFGKVTYVDEPCFAIDTTFFIDSRLTQVHLRWLYYALQLLKLDEFSQDSAVPGLGRDFVYEQWLPSTTPLEQRAIAAFLDRETAKIDALIARKERLIELLQEKRTALISHVVTKGLDPDVPMRDSGVEWIGQIPRHWSLARLRELSALIQDIDHNMPASVEDGVPFLSAKDLLDDGTLNFADGIKMISEEDYARLSRKVKPRRNDIIYSRIGARLGKARLVHSDERFLVSYSCCVIRLLESRASTDYVCYVLDSELVLIEARLKTQSIGVPDLGLDEIGRFLIPLPPHNEQDAIAHFLDRETDHIRQLIVKVQLGVAQLYEYRTALISAAVTGKIDVRGEVET